MDLIRSPFHPGFYTERGPPGTSCVMRSLSYSLFLLSAVLSVLATPLVVVDGEEFEACGLADQIKAHHDEWVCSSLFGVYPTTSTTMTTVYDTKTVKRSSTTTIKTTLKAYTTTRYKTATRTTRPFKATKTASKSSPLFFYFLSIRFQEL